MRIVRALLFVSLVAVMAVPIPAAAQTQTQNGTMDVSALVLGPPPADPPTIDEPVNGAVVDVKNIEVRGGCIVGLVVRIFENGDFVGSTVCQSNGQFNLHIDLVPGTNTLTARQYDSANQPSPTSTPVTVTYNPPTPVTPPTNPASPPTTEPHIPPSSSTSGASNPGDTPLKLEFDYDYLTQSIIAGQQFHLPVHFVGGTPPYAIAIDWGDGITTVVSRQDTLNFDLEHTYRQGGVYTVRILVSDSAGQKASMEFIMIVSGDRTSEIATPIGTIDLSDARALIAWLAPTAFALGIIVGSIVFPSGFSVAKWLIHHAAGAFDRLRQKRHKQ